MSEPSVNSKVRLLGEVGTTEKPSLSLTPRTPPQSAAPPVSITPPPPHAPVPAEPIFLGDSADGADLLNAGQIVQPLAQLCVTPQVQTPFLAAILGPSGAGKTFALRRFAQAIEQLGVSSATAGGGVLHRVVLARVDASSRVEAPVAIATAAYAALDREPGGVDYSGLLDETGHAGGDPHRAARAASDRHDDLVRKLEAERTQRDDIEAKRAADRRYAGVRHPRLSHRRLRPRAPRNDRGAVAPVRIPPARTSTRAIATWRATCRPSGRAGAPRSLFDRYGPTAARRACILWAIVAFVLGFLIRLLHSDAAVAAVGGANDWLKPVAGWIAAHGDWFDRASEILYPPRRVGHRAQPVARASVLQHSPARFAAAHFRGPRTAPGPRRAIGPAQSARRHADRRGRGGGQARAGGERARRRQDVRTRPGAGISRVPAMRRRRPRANSSPR